MNKYIKGLLIAIAVATVVFILSMWGHWMVLEQKFNEDPLFYYNPRTIEHANP